MLFLLVLALTPSFQQAKIAGAPRIHPRRLLVRIDPSLARTSLSTLRPELGVRELWNLPQIGWRAIEVDAGQRDAIKQRLEQDPVVLQVCYDPRRELAYTPNDLTRTSGNCPGSRPGLGHGEGDPGGRGDRRLRHRPRAPDLAANLWTTR
jgi:hypothetical protein